MLRAGKTYRNNAGKLLKIGGRIRDYSAERRWVWAIHGDWYDEKTGAFITYVRAPAERPGELSLVSKLLAVDNHRSISNHTPIEEK